MKPILYGTAACPACVQARTYLSARRVSFTDRRVDADARAADEAARAAMGAGLDPTSVPILVVGGNVIQGFHPEQWDAALMHQTGLGEVNVSLGSPFWGAVSVVSSAVSAYHGYKRNNSVGWAIWWGLMGGIFPILTPVIALAMGYAKPARR